MPISFNNVDKVYHGTTPIKKVYRGSVIEWDGTPYFYIKNEYSGNNTFTLTKTGTPSTTDLSYSKDKITWTNIKNGGSVSLATGEKLYLRSTTGFSSGNTSYYTISCSENFSAGGPIYTLINYNNPNLSALPDYSCRSMFNGATKLVSISNIDISNITSVGIRGFAGACQYCSSLVDVFDTSSITSLSDNAFAGACQYCSSLVECFDLSGVTTVGNISLNYLYSGCSSLQIVISPNISTWTATSFWVENVAATGTFINTRGIYIPTGANGIPTGWVEEIKNNNIFRIKNEYSGNNTITITKVGSPDNISLNYSRDNGSNWYTWNSSSGNFSTSISSGQQLIFRGNNTKISKDGSNYFKISGTQNHSVGGNIMYLLNTSGNNISIADKDYCFARLFFEDTKLTSAKSLVIPATDLPTDCFNRTFYGATALTAAPSLTVRVAGTGCCNTMFCNATNLVDVSGIHLNAETLNVSSYKMMFLGTKIVDAPEIMATSISDGGGNTNNGSLAYMFQDCTSLKTIKVHFADWQTGLGTKDWTKGVGSTGTFYKSGLLASTKNPSGNPADSSNYIPYNWNVVNTDNLRIINNASGTNTITLSKQGIPDDITLDYSVDDGSTWNTWSSANGNLSVQLDTNKELRLKGNNNRISFDNNNYYHFDSTDNFSVSGNLISLLDSTGSTVSINTDGCFSKLFYNATHLVNLENMTVPIQIVPNDCFKQMCYGCTSLTKGPEFIYVESIGEAGFEQAFMNCTNLIWAPKFRSLLSVGQYGLNATFKNCDSLRYAMYTNTVEILGICAMGETYYGCSHILGTDYETGTPLVHEKISFPNLVTIAGTPLLGNGVFYRTFYDSSIDGSFSFGSLQSIPTCACEEMFARCAITNPPVMSHVEEIGQYGCLRMFEASYLTEGVDLRNCTSVGYNGCSAMYNSCVNLNKAYAPTVEWSTSNFSNWLANVAASGNLYANSSVNIPSDTTSGCPSGWTIRH